MLILLGHPGATPAQKHSRLDSIIQAIERGDSVDFDSLALVELQNVPREPHRTKGEKAYQRIQKCIGKEDYKKALNIFEI